MPVPPQSGRRECLPHQWALSLIWTPAAVRVMIGAEMVPLQQPFIQGRGSAENPRNRFVPLDVVRDADADPDEMPAPATLFLKDTSRKIITRNDSPDVGFEFSINPYRGCEHGCIYCYARPTHEWLGFSGGLDFETRILVKEDAPELLRAELADRKWEPR